MNSSWFLARRLLFWRQERRTPNWSAVTSIAGVAVGAAVLVLTLSILNGFEAQVWDSLLRFEQPAVLMPRADQVDRQAAIAALEEIGIDAQPYAERKLVVQSAEGYRLVSARIVPDLPALMESFSEVILHQLSYPPKRYGVMMGITLADRLGLLPGDELRILSPLDISLADPKPPQLAATLQAVYEFGILDFDEAYLFLDFQAAGELVPRLDAYSGLSLAPTGGEELELPPDLLDQEAWQLRTWEEGHTDLLTAMKMEKLGSTVVLFLIILVASFNATGTMVMSVMEKYREIGILRSMGATRGFIRELFLRQGLLIGLLGVSAGVGIGVTIALVQTTYPFIPGPQGLYMEGGLPMDLRWRDVFVVLMGAIAICLGAAWYPARYATSIEPGLAVNYEK